MIEVWKPIEDYEGRYEISNLGNVKSHIKKYDINSKKVTTGYILKNNDNGKGYKYVTLFGNGFKDRRYIHRLVAQSFLEQNIIGLEVNHKDGKKSNNCVENLEWVTKTENANHAYRTGLRKDIGEGSHFSKLTDCEAKVIKILALSDVISTGEIMNVFKVDRHTVLDIKKGIRFAHLT